MTATPSTIAAIAPALWGSFERIYSTDLVYIKDCWKLCGDAHCCNFSRYKSRFRLISKTPFQEIPLLPGEYQFLEQNGWLTQFGDYDLKVTEYELSNMRLKIDSIISRRPNCACDHATRPVVCRLYPLLPVFDIEGTCINTEPTGIFEELEQIAGLSPACQVHALPFDEMEKFLTIAGELSKHPLLLFYLEAYRLTKRHISQRLADAYSAGGPDIFSVFESAFLRNRLIHQDTLRPQLDDLARQFVDYYGASFFETAN